MLLAPPTLAQVVSPPITNRNVQLTTTVTGYTPSQYVSGTNQSFTITAQLVPVTNHSGLPKWTNYWLTDVQIIVGGTAVKSWTSDPNNPVQSKSFSVEWDTTHFAHGATPMVECDADAKVERLGPSVPPNPPVVLEGPVSMGPAKADVTVSVYNVGFSGEDLWITIDDPVAYMIDAELADMNYSHRLVQGTNGPGGWTGGATETNCLPPVGTSTVYYFAGDGLDSPSSFGDPGNKDGDTNRWNIYSSDVQSARTTPPPSALMSFVLIDTCLTGKNNTMATAFLYPTPLSSAVDQAYVGWRILAYPNWLPIFAPELFNELFAGWSVGVAQVDAWYYLQQRDPNDANLPPPTALGTSQALYGDVDTTIHGLYGWGTDLLDNPPAFLWYNVTVIA